MSYFPLIESRIYIFYFMAAFAESRFDNIEERDPAANENEITPDSMRIISIIFSKSVSAVMSPNPTVVIVVTVK